jgi:cytoskeletal protein RodZ
MTRWRHPELDSGSIIFMPEPSLFKTKTVKIDTLGEYLAQIRKQLNLDVKTVGLLAQIKPTYLSQLESGDYDSLPSEVYIRGFLKSLADFYRIKEQLLIDQYEKERGFDLTKQDKKKTIRLFSFTPRTIVIVSSVLIALLALGYIGIQIRSVLAAPYLQITEPVSDQTIETNSIVVAGKAEVGSVVLINNQPVLIDSSGQFTENLLLSPGSNIIEISEKNRFNKVSEVTRQIVSNYKDTQQQPVAQAVNLEVQIGPNSAWIYLEVDGVVVQRGTMLPGSSKSVSAKSEIILTSANAGSTDVTYNGKDLGKLGREGEVIRNVQFSSQ